MFIYHKFSISTTAYFVPSEFPQLVNNIQQVIKQLAGEPIIKIEMLISFVTNHSINSVQVEEYPRLASLISGKSLPLQLMESLFEAGRNNPEFVKELEDYIRNCFATATHHNDAHHSKSLS